MHAMDDCMHSGDGSPPLSCSSPAVSHSPSMPLAFLEAGRDEGSYSKS